MKEITDMKELKRLVKLGQNIQAVNKRLFDTGKALGRNFNKIEAIDNNTEFAISDGVFRGGGWITRKIKNFRFFIATDEAENEKE